MYMTFWKLALYECVGHCPLSECKMFLKLTHSKNSKTLSFYEVFFCTRCFGSQLCSHLQVTLFMREGLLDASRRKILAKL
jgi:hypothetical protein